MSSKTKPTIVLVHGAWHHYSGWQYIEAELKKLGYDSVAPDLPSAGSDPPHSNHYEDAAVLKKELEKLIDDEGKEIILFMHSYGGVVGTEAAAGFDKAGREARGQTGGIIAQIYGTAFAIPGGTSLLDNIPAQPEWLQMVDDKPGQTHVVGASEVMYNDIDKSVAEPWIQKLRTHPIATFASPLRKDAWEADVKYVYIVCNKDQCLPLPWQYGMMEKLGASKFEVEVLEASHSFWLSHPVESAEMVDRIAQKV